MRKIITANDLVQMAARKRNAANRKQRFLQLVGDGFNPFAAKRIANLEHRLPRRGFTKPLSNMSKRKWKALQRKVRQANRAQEVAA